MKTKALSISVSLTIILIAVMTIATELSKEFETLLANLLFHHWIAKGIISLVFFVLVYLILSKLVKEDDLDIKKETILVVATTIISGLIIFGFYVWHFFFF